MGGLADLSLTDGIVPTTAAVLACAGAVLLLARKGRRWPAVVVLCAALSAATVWGISAGLQTFTTLTDAPLPWEIMIPGGLGILAVLLALAHLFTSRWAQKILAPIAAALVLVFAALQINAYYGISLTAGELTGAQKEGILPLPAAATKAHLKMPKQGTTADEAVKTWKAPEGLPARGSVYSVQIPGTRSGFAARTGYVYLPPAYKAKKRPRLPVMVLLTGQPGNPGQWLGSGAIQKIMDEYASHHQGLAPIVVMPDATGLEDRENLCMDSQIAQADTYLARDVPAWIKDTLLVDENPQHWVVGGFSFGGSCALQMITRHPEQYRSGIIMSGEAEPALSPDRSTTIKEAFNGDAATFTSLVPLTLLAKNRYPDSAAYFSAGDQDAVFSAHMNKAAPAARASGMAVKSVLLAGVGHSWRVPTATLGPALEWLDERIGLEPARR